MGDAASVDALLHDEMTSAAALLDEPVLLRIRQTSRPVRTRSPRRGPRGQDAPGRRVRWRGGILRPGSAENGFGGLSPQDAGKRVVVKSVVTQGAATKRFSQSHADPSESCRQKQQRRRTSLKACLL